MQFSSIFFQFLMNFFDFLGEKSVYANKCL